MYKIETKSKEIFRDVVKTLIVIPYSTHIFMLANGVSPADFDNLEEKYLEECKQHKIIPFSSVGLDYDSASDLFIPQSNQNILHLYRSFSQIRLRQTTEALLKGGKIHRLTIQIPDIGLKPSYEKGFQKLRDGFLDVVLENEYQFYNGDLWIKEFGTSQPSHLSLKTENGISRLELELAKGFTVPYREKLTEWFNQLSARYS